MVERRDMDRFSRPSVRAAPALALLALLLLASSSNSLAHGAPAVATVNDGGPSDALAYDSAKGEIFVANTGTVRAIGHTVSVISDSTNDVVATINVGDYPDGVAYDPAKGEIFVSNNFNDTVSVISDASNSVVATISLPGAADGLGYDSGKGEVFATYGSGAPGSPNAIAVISDSNNTVVATINVNQSTTTEMEILQTLLAGVAYDPAKGEVFVANEGLDTVLVIADSNNSVVATIPVGSYPYGLAYDSSKAEVFVANSNEDNYTSVISAATNTVVANVTVGQEPVDAAYDAANGEVLVANIQGSVYVEGDYNGTSPGTVSVISDSTNSVVSTIPVVVAPSAIVYDSGNGETYVPSAEEGTMSVISSSTAASSLATSSKSSSISLSSAYVAIAAIDVALIVGLWAVAVRKGRIRHTSGAHWLARYESTFSQ